MKHNGIAGMIGRLDDNSRYEVHRLSDELKDILTPLFNKHMKNILDGSFSTNMMEDWKNNDTKLLNWRNETGLTAFEKSSPSETIITNQEYFDKGILMLAFVKSGVELAFETMVNNGIIDESAYYESLHELPLIANLVARKKLYEMNRIISDTAEYGCYLFNNECVPLLKDFISNVDKQHLGGELDGTEIDKVLLNKYDLKTKNHRIEKIGITLRKNMSSMKKLK